jgi:hypothetical protein
MTGLLLCGHPGGPASYPDDVRARPESTSDVVEKGVARSTYGHHRTDLVRAHVEESPMTTTNTAHATAVQTQPVRAPRPAVRRVLTGSIGAAAAGAVVVLGYGALAIAVHGPMQAGDMGASEAAPINAASFAIGVAFSSFFAILIALAIGRWAGRPARTFQRTAIALTVVSLAAPLGASHTDEATRLLLAGGHVVAALVVIPLIVSALRTTPTGS